MNLGPWLIVRGSMLGSILIVLFSSLLTDGTQATAVEIPVAALPATSNDAIQNNLPGECTVSTQFPDAILQWCELIQEYANDFQLSPDLIAALIWYESGGKPAIISRSGAVGLMQVMPSDGKADAFQCINGPCFKNRPTTEELSNPEFNIKYGTRMLANLARKHGNLRDALKAYGPMNYGYKYADKVLAIFDSYGRDQGEN